MNIPTPDDFAAPTGAEESMEEQFERLLEEEKALREEEERQLQRLASEIEAKFNEDAAQRQRKETEWYWAERLALGSMWKYWNRWSSDTSDSPFQVRDAEYIDGDKPEFNIVKPKMKIGMAQMDMMQFGAGTDKNFQIQAKQSVAVDANLASNLPVFHADGVSPMVDPETGEPLTLGQLSMRENQANAERARKMDEEVWGQLSAAEYGPKCRQGFGDLLWYGTAIYHGPKNNNKSKKVRYETKTSDGSSLWITAYTEEPAPDFDRINPWLFYPDHRALCIDDAEHATVVHIYTPTQFSRLAKQGFQADKIQKLLQTPPRSNYYNAFRARAIQYNNTKFLENKYVVLEWHGTVGKDKLQRLGIEPPYDNPFDLYKAEIWVCQGEVLYASLEMLEADECLPFAVDVWEPDPASLFGFGSILLRDAQRVVNMTYQMVLDNAGLSAMPQVAIDTDAYKPQDGKPEIVPGKLWRIEPAGAGKPIQEAIQFFYPPNNLEPLITVLNMAREFGNEESIIPLISGGLDDPKVGDTGATGMALRLQSSTTVLSSKARQWDDNITKRIVGWFYEWNMQYSPKNEIKGDYDVDVQTSTAYLSKIVGQRDLERLAIQASQDPNMKFLVNLPNLYRAMLTGMNIPYEQIIYSEEESKRLQQQAAEAAQGNPDPASIKAQADMVNAQARMRDTENDAAKIEYEREEGMARAQMDQQEALANYDTRNNEARSRAIAAAADRDVAIAGLAMKNEQAANKLVADLAVKQDQAIERQFAAGFDAHQKVKKLDLEERNVRIKEREADKAERTGDGW